MSLSYFNYILAQQAEKEARKLHRRHIRDATNPFELPDNEFRHIYRGTKHMVLYLFSELEQELKPLNTHDGLPAHIKVLASLQLLGSGSYQRGTGQDHVVCIGQTTVSKYLQQFVTAVNAKMLPIWIVFPGDEESRGRISRGFQTKYGLPDILGAIDCTHVEIFPPPGPQHVQWLNRKNKHTLNVQLVVDSDCRVININSRYPGRVHDQYIFSNSNLNEEMKRLYHTRIGSYYLLGDSGYALEPWIMTPVLNARPGSPEDKFTKWHCKVRNVVERANGYLKGTFRCLGCDRALHYAPAKASEMVVTCAILYNIMLNYRVPMEFQENVPMEEQSTNVTSGAVPIHLGHQRRAQKNTHRTTSGASQWCYGPERHFANNLHITGDSGYALEPWIMTPVLNARPGSPEDKFTKWHCKVRDVVERANGYLKGTFRCLGCDRALHYAPAKASEMVVTCAILYNIMLNYRVPMEFQENVPMEEQSTNVTSGAVPIHLGHQRRAHIINRFFN